LLVGGAGYAGWHFAGRALYASLMAPSTPAAPPVAPKKVEAPVPAPAPVAPVPADLRKVAIILFPLDAHAFDGKTDLGMMPILLELKPGESKTLEVAHKSYVTRRVRIDGTKPRVVIGLVSNALAAKKKGMSQAEQEAAADRAAEVHAETVVLEEAEEQPGSIPEVAETAEKQPEKGATAPEKGAKPAPAGKGKKGKPAPSDGEPEAPPKP
jgi:hypothetical protein